MGLAGVGKTLLTKNFGEWLKEEGSLKISRVNLDPGVKWLPYKPDIDIRSYVSVEEVMVRDHLGTNSALLKAVSEIEKKWLKKVLSQLNGRDLYVFDTPGLFELFAFRPLGEKLIQRISNLNPVGVHVVDASKKMRPGNVLIQVFIAFLSSLHLEIPTVICLNKIDLLPVKEKDQLINVVNNFDLALENIKGKESGLRREFLEGMLEVLQSIGLKTRIALISSKTGEGFFELFDLINEVECACGDIF